MAISLDEVRGYLGPEFDKFIQEQAPGQTEDEKITWSRVVDWRYANDNYNQEEMIKIMKWISILTEGLYKMYVSECMNAHIHPKGYAWWLADEFPQYSYELEKIKGILWESNTGITILDKGE